MNQTPKIEVITERPLLAAGSEQTIDALIRVIPPDPISLNARPRLNLSLVLDRSGSMEGEKIVRAREAARYCVDQLLPSDRISLVIFDDQIDVLIPSRVAGDRADIRERIMSIAARGSTALHQAWVSGGIQVSEYLFAGAINRVLLITDGLANVGETRTQAIVQQARELAAKGVTTSTIGIGRDFNEDLLIPMGTQGGGNSWHVAEPNDMERIFMNELQGLIAQVGHTVTLELTPGPGVKVLDLLNDFELTSTGAYKLPNLLAGSPLEIVARLRLPARRAGERVRALDLCLAWKPQATAGKCEELLHQTVVEFADKEESDACPTDERVTRAVTLLMAARANGEAVKLIDKGDIVAARNILASSLDIVACYARNHENSGLCRQVELQAEVIGNLSGPAADLAMSRKKLSYQGHSLRRSQNLE
jgi:Ca-activated chloride channel family protein